MISTAIKSLAANVLLVLLIAACSPSSQRREVAPQPSGDSTVGAILRQYSIQRSLQDCREKALTEEQCKKSVDDGQRHLDSVYARINALLKDPKTNTCDLVRFVGACADPNYTLADWADCMQVLPDRGEALNSGRFVFKLDPRGCPTGTAIKIDPAPTSP
jgi:hypothetical protein